VRKNWTLSNMKQELTDRTLPPLTRSELIHRSHLNSREAHALDLVTQGLENKEIAQRMKISLPLAKKLLRTSFRKLGVKRRVEAAVRWAQRDS
jgi:DNA-binding CsgD family transcriptional regulator